MILITGATGNVGAALAQILASQGTPVRLGVHRLSAGATVPPGSELVRCDFADPSSFAPALCGVARLFLVRPPAITNTQRYLNPFIDAARHAGVQQIVFLSLLGAARNPVVPHYAVERYLERSDVGWTLLRPSFFMQNLSTTHRREIHDLHEIIVPAGAGRTSFIDVRDIAAVAARTLSEPGHIGQAYTLTGDEALSYHNVAQILSATLERPIQYRQPSLLRFIRYRRSQGDAWAYIAVMVGIYSTARLGRAATITPTTRTMLGRPAIRFAQFSADHRTAWRG
jgi:uncharacterized protein YbjT (DUF2867 family)